MYYGIRDKTRTIADQHANLGRTVESSIVEHLRKLQVEIKAHIRVSLCLLLHLPSYSYLPTHLLSDMKQVSLHPFPFDALTLES